MRVKLAGLVLALAAGSFAATACAPQECDDDDDCSQYDDRDRDDDDDFEDGDDD